MYLSKKIINYISLNCFGNVNNLTINDKLYIFIILIFTLINYKSMGCYFILGLSKLLVIIQIINFNDKLLFINFDSCNS